MTGRTEVQSVVVTNVGQMDGVHEAAATALAEFVGADAHRLGEITYRVADDVLPMNGGDVDLATLGLVAVYASADLMS